MDGDAGLFFEEAAEVVGGDVKRLGDLFKGEVVLEMDGEISPDLVDEIVMGIAAAILYLLYPPLLISPIYKLPENGESRFLHEQGIRVGRLGQKPGEEMVLQVEGRVAEGVGE